MSPLVTGLWTLLVLAPLPALAAGGIPPADPIQGGLLQKGVALGLFSEDAGWSYRPLLEEIARTGADHVELVVPWYLRDVRSTEVHDHPRYTPPPETIARTIREAHRAGLQVLLFPIVRLEVQKNPDEWRGTLQPADRAAFFASYTRRLVELARLAARERVEVLSVGSEMSTLDVDRAAWVPVVAGVRRVYRGPLLYSGNWDHYQKVAIYDLLDYVGMCAYFKLAEEGQPATTSDEALERRWLALRDELGSFAARLGRPLVLTEVGYLSQRGAAAWPWNEGATEPVDLEEQRRCYRAFVAAWLDDPPGGVYFWNWYGWGGERSGGYTPRGKPAAEEIERFFRNALTRRHRGAP